MFWKEIRENKEIDKYKSKSKNVSNFNRESYGWDILVFSYILLFYNEFVWLNWMLVNECWILIKVVCFNILNFFYIILKFFK